MSLIHKIHDFFRPYVEENDDSPLWDELFVSKIDKLDKTSEYPISPYQAFKIAEQNNNLKSDYFRNASKYITYLNFSNCKVDLIDGDNGRKYYLVNITKGKVSWIDDETFYDGFLCDNDFDLLQCLVDVETGEYIYYPKK